MLKQAMQLAQIPEESYVDYRYDAIFHAYKWDPQVEDQNTVSKHVLLMNKETATQLETWAEALAKETVEMEQELLHNKKLAKKLGLPTQVYKALDGMQNYDSEKHVRLMRFDFHPTVEGWAVSEVNSDVPGGLAEATALPQIAAKYFNGFIPHKHIGEQLYTAFQKRAGDHANIAFVHATSYADDRQVMQFLGDYFDAKGFHSSYIAPDHIRFVNEEAINIAEGEEGELDGIVRFFPLEWLVNLPKHSKWKGYYSTKTTSCNHPIAIFAQSKRLPLIWNELDCDIQTWKALLPETKDPKGMKAQPDGWIFKPALGRVGEGISVKEAITAKELKKIEKSVKAHPQDWIMQRKFESDPLLTEDGTPYHLCVGVFVVDGKSAGFYGRISQHPRIDAKAKDIPILVEAKGATNEA